MSTMPPAGNRFLLLPLLLALTPAAAAQLLGTPEQDDHFGGAFAVGDYNGDGEDDLAVGAADEDLFVNNVTLLAAGAVSVIYGTGGGLDDAGNQYWTQNNVTGTLTAAEDHDGFGWALAAGDFDGDGFSDLAIGTPLEEAPGEATDHGEITVLYGSALGLTNVGFQTWSQAPLLVAGNAEEGDQFGYALAAGDFDGDGYDDLAVGVPFDHVLGGPADAGAVNVLFGAAGTGLSTGGNTLFHQDRTGILDEAEFGDRFGATLAVGQLNSDGYDDLAVGIPYEDVGAVVDAGAVGVLYGSAVGLTDAGDQLWNQNSAGVGDAAEAADLLGTALAVGDFDNDDVDDLAIGAPYEDYGALADVGQLHVLYGTGSGLTGSGSLHLPAVPGAQTDYRVGSAFAAGDFDGDGFEDLAVGGPGRDFGAVVDGGLAAVLFGSVSGVLTTGYQVWHQNVPGIPETAEAGDVFGYALAAGDFDSDHLRDLAIAAPGESVGSVPTAGVVHVLYGVVNTGLTATGDQLWYQGGTGSFTGDGPEALAAGTPEASAGTGAPAAPALLPAVPNPFGGRTTIRFTLPVAGPVRLAVHDALGRTVAVLVDEARAAGQYAVAFDGSALPAGVYVVRIEAAGQARTQRLTALR